MMSGKIKRGHLKLWHKATVVLTGLVTLLGAAVIIYTLFSEGSTSPKSIQNDFLMVLTEIFMIVMLIFVVLLLLGKGWEQLGPEEMSPQEREFRFRWSNFNMGNIILIVLHQIFHLPFWLAALIDVIVLINFCILIYVMLTHKTIRSDENLL